MPLSGKTGFNEDMPAIWVLNAQIPLTSQYGTNEECSCVRIIIPFPCNHLLDRKGELTLAIPVDLRVWGIRPFRGPRLW